MNPEHLDPLRLTTLHDFGILDTERDPRFDEITAHVAEVCGVPVALVSLVETDRQWFKSACGVDLDGTPIEQSICVHALLADELFEIPDCTADPRTAGNPLVTGEMHLRFYAGAVLRASNGKALGALCALDTRPRTLDATQRRTLVLMARQVMRLLELRKALAEAEVLRREIDHRVKNSLQSISSLIKIRRRKASPEVAEALGEVDARLRSIALLHESIYRSDAPETVRLGDYLERFGTEMSGLMSPLVRLTYDCDVIDLPARTATSLTMVIAEFVANSLKHGFPGDRAGTISIAGRRTAAGYELTLADDGVGMAGTPGEGMGMKVIAATLAQIGAETLSLPPAPAGHRMALRISASAS